MQVVADITRWEIQLRYRRGMTNWRTAQTDLPKLKKYKRGFFAEWRWADREKDHLLNTMDFYLDMTTEGEPAWWTALPTGKLCARPPAVPSAWCPTLTRACGAATG